MTNQETKPAMVGEQEPQRCDDCGDTVPKRKCYCRAGCVHEATPVAQQYEAGDMASAFAQGFRDGVASVAQQPQAEAVQYTRADLDRAYSAGLVEGERLAIQQAEAVPSEAEIIAVLGDPKYSHITAVRELIRRALAAPQQAEAVPSDVVLDAERYRWLRNESWAGYNTGKGTPSVYTVDGAGNRRMMLAEEAMDDAIDAAIAQQKGQP